MCSKCIFLNHKPINKTHKRFKKKKKNQVKPKTLHSFKEMNTAYIHKLKGHLKYTLTNFHSFDFVKGPVTITYNRVHTINFFFILLEGKKTKQNKTKNKQTKKGKQIQSGIVCDLKCFLCTFFCEFSCVDLRVIYTSFAFC